MGTFISSMPVWAKATVTFFSHVLNWAVIGAALTAGGAVLNNSAAKFETWRQNLRRSRLEKKANRLQPATG